MVKIAVGGIIAILMAVLFKKSREEMAIYITITGCILILLWGISKLEVILDAIDQLQGYIKMNKAYVGILIKIIGITYITEISASICNDSGYHAISEQIQLVGKLTILAISMPIMLALLETINNFLVLS
jgi:stage III sporulation protein AD